MKEVEEMKKEVTVKFDYEVFKRFNDVLSHLGYDTCETIEDFAEIVKEYFREYLVNEFGENALYYIDTGDKTYLEKL